jgi:tetratricopeptide (TPR) repeat protein
MNLRIVTFLLTVLLMGTGQAHAETDKGSAAEHFGQGVELYQEGNLDAALVEFERAYELSPNFRVLYNLAQVQAERQQYVLATDLFERYLSEGKTEISVERKAAVLEELQRLHKRIADLWVEANVDGVEVFIDGVSVGRLPLATAIPINAGVINVRLEKSGFESQTQRMSVAGEEHPRLSVEMVPLASSARAREPREGGPKTDPEPQLKPNRTAFWVSAAATGAFAGAAATFGVLALNADSKLEDEFDQFPTDSAQIKSTRDDIKLYSILADGLGAGAIVCAGIAVYFLVNPKMVPVDESQEVGFRSIRVIGQPKGVGLAGRF